MFLISEFRNIQIVALGSYTQYEQLFEEFLNASLRGGIKKQQKKKTNKKTHVMQLQDY